MKQNNLISVIIPVYNVEQYLRRCLDSVINQTYKNLEILLIDDGATDNSPKICDEYALKDSRIKVIHKQNGGVSSARNVGLDIANGDYIGFVDSDDYIKSNMYEILLTALSKTNLQLVVCNWFEGAENNWIENKNFPTKDKLTINNNYEIFNYNYMFVWNKLFRKDILNNINFFEVCSFGEDEFFSFNIFNKLRELVFVHTPLYYHRNNLNSIIGSHKFKKEYLYFMSIIDIEIIYATNNKLLNFKNVLYQKKLKISTAWLGFIALQNKIDIDSARYLLKFIKKNLLKFLNTKEKLSKKCFVLIACINFKFASRIYKLVYKNRIF